MVKVPIEKFLDAEDVKSAAKTENGKVVLTVIGEGELIQDVFNKDREKLKINIAFEDSAGDVQERAYTPNWTTLKLLVKAWGDETKFWDGKQILVWTQEQRVGKELKDVIYGKPKTAT